MRPLVPEARLDICVIEQIADRLAGPEDAPLDGGQFGAHGTVPCLKKNRMSIYEMLLTGQMTGRISGASKLETRT